MKKEQKRVVGKVVAGAMMTGMLFALAGCQSEDEDDRESRGRVEDHVEDPTPEPTEEPTPEPTAEPTEEPTPEPTEEPTPEPTQASVASGYSAPTELSDSLYDYQIRINDDILQLPMYVDDLLAQGWEASERLSDLSTGMRPSTYDLYYFEKDGVRLCADVMNWDVNERTAGECVINGFMVDRFDAKEADVQVPGGIDWNASTADDVVATYGTPSYENETSSLQFIKYEEDTRKGIEFQFDLATGELRKIELNYFVKPEGFAEGTVSTDVPELTAKYQAPSALSDEPKDFIMEVDGAMYQLPCPVSEFVNNGWEIVTDKSEETVEGRGAGKVTLRKNNFSFWSYVRNYDDNATAIENCFLNNFELRDHDANVTVKVCGGVEYHQSKDEAMQILEPLGFTFEESDTGKEGSGYIVLKYESFKKYEFYVSDGIIKDMCIVNELKRDELFQ